MKVLHICLASFYIDNYSYQENLLPKYHKQLGLEVEILASLETFDDNGSICYLPKGSQYVNENGIPVKRLEYKKSKLNKKLRRYIGTYYSVNKSKPDIIFIHGCQFLDIKHIARYAKENPNVTIYVDNHADFSNSAGNWLSKNILHKIIWKKCAKTIDPYTKKFYGVLPIRVDFLKEVYKIDENKVELLLMGAEDEKVKLSQKADVIRSIKNENNVSEEDFLIVTGGKIDKNKPQTLLLMKAVAELNDPNIKLLVFGSINKEYKESFKDLLNDNIKYTGWINSDKIYEYFSAADLIVFPGLHSVLWEQAVGVGKPCVFRYMEGFTHVDLNGNCKFIYEDSVEAIKNVLKQIIYNPNIYYKMKNSADNNGKNIFSYKHIAEKSISN